MVTVIDNNTCTLILEFSLTEPTQIVVNLDEIIQVDCFGNETGSIDVSGSGGVPPYNFQWSNGDNSAQILNLTGGTYSVTVSDNTGCTEIASFEITEPEVLLSEVTINALPLCFGDSTGLAMVTSSGGTGNYSYLWSNGETGNIAENLVAGDYYVITSDQNNCADTVSFTITQPDELELALSATNETAEGAADGTATVAVSGGQSPYTFMWSNDSTSQSITELTPGNYTVTVTDANNCEASGTVTISAVNCLLAVELFIQDESCLNASDGVIQTSVSGGTEPYIYTWSNGSTDSTQIQLPAGSYSVTIIDADSCSIEAEGIVNMGNEVIFEFGNIIQPVCQDDETGQIGITITSGQAPFNIVWSTGDTTSATTGVKPGSYSVTVSDNAACSYSDNFVLEHLDTIPPEIICPIINTSYCGPTVIEYPFPTFIDNCPGGTIEQIAGIGSGNEFPIGEHTEVFLATDTSGNADTCSFTFIISGDFITTAITEDESCAGLCDGSVTIEISGGAPPYSITPENFDNLCAGIYTYSITDAQGCEVEISIEIEAAPEFLLVSVDAMDASSTGNDGFIDIEIEGGAQPFVYDWTKDGDPFSDQEDISDLGPGVYNCMITNANGCVISTEEIIIEMESSTNELNLLESVEIYPNPASNVLMIKWDQIPSNNIEYAIKGVDGKIWKSKAWNGELISQINVDDLPEAIYFVHLRSEHSQASIKLILIFWLDVFSNSNLNGT